MNIIQLSDGSVWVFDT